MFKQVQLHLLITQRGMSMNRKFDSISSNRVLGFSPSKSCAFDALLGCLGHASSPTMPR
jgi:hypothetical protein